MSSLTNALILTAGLGTRLRPLTTVRAKPAIPVAGVPMVGRIIRWLASSGVTDVVMNLHHLPETIAAAVGDGSEYGVRARYSWEQPRVLGSAGGPRQALEIVGRETFVIVNGDTLTDVDLRPLAAAHERHDALVTMAVTDNPDPSRYSGLKIADDGAVVGVVAPGTGPSYHFIGVQVVHREAFAHVEPGQFANSVGDVYSRLIAQRPGSVRAHRCEAAFWDIGTVNDYWVTSRAFAGDGELIDPLTHSGDDVQLEECIIWSNVHIGASSRLTRCIVTDHVKVAPRSVYSDAILLRGADGETIVHPLPGGTS
jgi:NDP-sugar pyrophosphorylase family protein